MLKRKLLICIALSLALGVFASAAFVKTETYTDGQFTDVPSSQWYASEVKSTFELGLMKGTGNGLFNPSGNVTVAEAVTMAARAASIYAGETIPASSGEWYQMYVDYGVKKGFIKEGQFDSYTRPAKRHEVASLFENAMPDGYFTALNDVDYIPDVSENQPYADDLLNLYNAGVVMGSDEYGRFNPDNNITRAEAAAIINRVAIPANRLSKELKTVQDKGAYVLARNTTYTLGARAGIRSGWLLDNRGGLPRSDTLSSYEQLSDVSETEGTAMIREFNKITEGKLLLRTNLNLSDRKDGVYLSYKNEDGEDIYRIETKDGAWCILNPDGTYTKIYDLPENTYVFRFYIEVDLEKGISKTNINSTDCGTHKLPIAGKDVNIYTFRFATTEKNTSTVSLGFFEIVVNYGVNEEFSYAENNKMPCDWESDTAYVTSRELIIPGGGKATKNFDAVGGRVVSEFVFEAPESRPFNFNLKGNNKVLVKFENDGKDFYANGVKIYENYVPEVVYIFRAEADTKTQKVDISVNGIKQGTVPFAESASFADTIEFNNSSEGNITIDNVYVYEEIKASDYVPVPVKPAGEEKYNVGINVCSIWQSDEHHGWNVNSPFADREPVLGYYDEGISETADWEIKYMVEHGIDFQAFCWYTDRSEGVQKLATYHAAADHMNAYKNAEYSDMMKYCLIWEAGTHKPCTSQEAWEKYFVPTWIEHFFKDERYMTIDNKPVLAIFGAGNVVDAFGGAAKTKERFDYLRNELKKLGYDGAIILSSHATDSQTFKDAGFDGGVAYNWSNAGYALDHNQKQILSNANKGFTYTVPTISVGFNSIPWWGIRYPMMSMNDFAAAQEWVKNEYLPTYAKEEWQKNLVWISTWNEYGEGTFIMPTTDEKGFGYVDILREAYTDEKANAALNTVPTPEQKERINHRYPQYRHLLRREGYEEDELSTNYDNYELLYKIDYATDKSVTVAHIDGLTKDENGLSGVSGADAIVYANSYEKDIDLSKVDAIRIRIKAPKNTILSVFHITTEDRVWDETKRTNFTHTTSEMTDVIIKAVDLKKMSGNLVGFRIDPVNTAGNEFTLVSAEFLSGSHLMSKDIYIDGQVVSQYFTPRQSEAGDWMVAFDPNTGLEFALDAFHTWDKHKEELTLYFEDHTAVFTAGKDTYLFDGKEKSLGYKITMLDSVPFIPIEKLCEDLGYDFSIFNGKQMVILTSNYEFYQKSAKELAVPGNWDFNLDGFRAGWGSNNMALLVNGGTMYMQTNSSHRDVQMINNGVSINSELYDSFEIKARYSYDGDSLQEVKMYFLTDRDQTWNEAKTIKFKLDRIDTQGEWETYKVDLKDNPEWKNTITNLRFDPFAALGYMELEYLRFNEDPNYVYIDPDTLPMTIKNPDAEGEECAFVTTNANTTKVDVINDPKNADNKCYRAMSKSEGIRSFCGLQQEVRYTAGAKYTIEFDAMLYSYDYKTGDDMPSFSAQLLANIKYQTSSGVDHVLPNRFNLYPGMGWEHFKIEFTVSADSTTRNQDALVFYTNPVDNLGVGFLIDNIKVTEEKPVE